MLDLSLFFNVQQNAQKKARGGVLIGQCTTEGTWRCLHWLKQTNVVQSVELNIIESTVLWWTALLELVC